MVYKRGFTLIELSIVLVIIGLIIGGILTGQELITSAAIRAQIAQIEKYNTAVHTFQNKYGGLPGDLPVSLASQFGFDVSGCDGSYGKRDGNGIIDGYWSGSLYVGEYEEATEFWADLSTAGLLDGTFPGGGMTYGNCGKISSTAMLTGGIYSVPNILPPAKIGNGNFIYAYDSNTVNTGIDNSNWYGISAVTEIDTNGDMLSTPALTVVQAQRIDQKTDDGVPTSGGVRAVYLNAEGVNLANPHSYNASTVCYNTTTNTYETYVNNGGATTCALSFRFQ